MAWPAVKKFLTPVGFRDYIDKADFSSWRPVGIVIHNTASPTLAQWHATDRNKRMTNLESYYKGLGWAGGPHLFIDDKEDGIGLFNPINKRGTHSPSFNAQWIGIEHVGDYAREDDDTGAGYKVKMNGIAAMAILCAKLGIDPRTHIKLHKEDPRTDHDCPGKDMAQDKLAIIESVVEFMGTGGDHAPDWGDAGQGEPPVLKLYIVDVPDYLVLREQSTQGSKELARLAPGTRVTEIGPSVKNGNTTWLRVSTPAPDAKQGWVSARYTRPLT